MLTFAYMGGGGAKGSCLRNDSVEKMLNNLDGNYFYEKN